MDISEINGATKPPIGRRMKGRAPPPPPVPQPAPRRIFSSRNAVPDGGLGSDDTKENVLHSSVDVLITLPEGFHTSSTVDGRKALMDLLVDLCSQHHLNPAHHTLELLSPGGKPLTFKPNTPLGALDVHHIRIREKVAEEKVARKPAPKVPEKTVRLVVNYHRTQKAVVRVNPLVPLGRLVPVICDKCEFDPSHVLLLRDNVSNHELDLDQSLSELGIKELYVLDQSLARQPKMASAPVLNCSESAHSNSLTAGKTQKRGLLGFFKFNRRRTKSEEHTSANMEDDDDKNVEGSESYCNGVPAASSRMYIEARPSTLGQSHSAVNLPRMSPKVEVKKRQAPPPPRVPPTLTRAPGSLDGFQISSSSSQPKKRKAPAPPPVPAPNLPVEDTASEMSHSTEDSEPVGSISSSSSSCMEVTRPAPSTTPEAEPTPSTTPEPEPVCSTTPKTEPARNVKPRAEPTTSITPKAEPTDDTAPEETEAALNLKLEEVENSRHSTMGAERQVPHKPHRVPPREPPQLEIPPPPPYSPPPTDQDEHQSQSETVESWLHSLQVCKSDPSPGVELEAETVSVASSSSCPDQGYAASEGIAEDSGVISSPSDLVHPASPDGSISLEQVSTLTDAMPKDSSSDSDEGCATWGSGHKHSNDHYHSSFSGRTEDSYEDPELTSQLHQTLADLEADLADIDRTMRVSVSELSVSSMDRSPHCEIPVSVVDCEVPVTTIDEVIEDYKHSMTDYEAALLRSTQISNGPNQSSSYQPNGHSENRNNNAGTSDGQLIAIEAPPPKVPPICLSEEGRNCSREQTDQSSVSQGTDIEPQPQGENRLQEEGQPAETQTQFQSIPSCSRVIPKVPVECPGESEPAAFTRCQTAQIKIAQSTASRFGMRTFTVIPPKPVLVQKPAGSLVLGAIKIDAQGNMVKNNDDAQNKYDKALDSASDSDVPLLGKAKAFWSSTEKQESSTSSGGHAAKTRDPEILRAPPVEPPRVLPTENIGRQRPEVTFGEVVEAAVDQLARRKPSSQDPTLQPLRTRSESEPDRDLSFLKPSRRTSSQYVASAIAKYTGKPACKAESVQEAHTSNRFSASEQKPTHTSSVTVQTTQTKPTMLVVNPKRSLSFPDYSSVKPESAAEMKQDSTNTSSLDRNPSRKASQSSKSLPLKPVSVQTPASPTQPDAPITRPVHNLRPAQNRRDETRPEFAKKPDSPLTPCGISEPGQVGPFGPTKKFKPVVLKSAPKESSLHSSLMEEIQMGEGKERLKRIANTPRESTLKKTSFAETGNEHSALLSAIRDQSNFSRLKKVQSDAASELEKYRKSAPITSPQSNDVTANPEQAREAMLEAIRSGSGAERLKKVPVSSKTVLINGRLGIVQTAASVPQGN
ncbi:hypothetical protein GJAV_G00017720 [Gymnothorax javanicus]|nr:hypothetical protein GJAV_G00017720 [Gymnothorax javanicus]